ncbi:uncharacterized protein C11orf16 homolog isoform X2 [Pseudoliparis swirei]|uniref:uncharacterized protein C11orf16 homolog isoform X2 n=1 Tax=Pseudoliparis swirei TaxID=2059687 RepID=UPI0024BD993F|nr:uncharacterized protein C11orf16 homolog isoform X2 [Pseudoliparis swirei]
MKMKINERHRSPEMTSGPPSASEAALVRLLLGGRRRNVTFVVDSSEGARAALGSVKRLLIRTLLTKASLRDSLFNIVTFSGELSCWSHRMLPCAPDTLYLALSWIHSIGRGPGGRRLLLLPAALSVALADPACHAVHLLCTGVPDGPGASFTGLPALAAGRPVNVFYLQDSGGRMDGDARDQLQCLSRATRGSCYEISVGLNGVLETVQIRTQRLHASSNITTHTRLLHVTVEVCYYNIFTRYFDVTACFHGYRQVIPLSVVETRSSAPTISPVRSRCPSTSVSIPHKTPSPPLSLWSPRCSLGNPCTPSGEPGGGLLEFYTGGRVLARREEDGLYYLGTVTQQVQVAGGIWVVEFDRPGGGGVPPPRRQVVCSLDMANHGRAGRSRRPGPGDAVLSPWEPDLRRYGPGRVMAAAANDGFGVDGAAGLRVLMWNRCVSLVPSGLVSPVSAPQHDRIVRELRLQTSASRRGCSWLPSSSCTSSSSSSCTPQPLCTGRCRSFPPGCGSGFRRAEWDEPPDLRDTDVRRGDPGVPPSSSSSSSSSSLSEDESRALKPRRNQPRPPWRYWRRTGSEPQLTPTDRSARTSRFVFLAPRSSASSNHSAPFRSLPGAKGRRRANVRDVFAATDFKPRPPASRRPLSVGDARRSSVFSQPVSQ